MTTFHFAVEDLTAPRNLFSCALAEEGAGGVVDPVQAGLRDGLRERGDDRREEVPGGLRRCGSQVRLAGVGVVADVVRRRLGASERALIEEEHLEVLAPAEAPVDARSWR